MSRPTLLALCLALGLSGLALSLPGLTGGGLPRGEEATHRLAAESLLAERDLVFDHRDLERGYRAWPSGPRGIALLSPDGGESFRFAVPIAASLAALPFVAWAGAYGWLVANGLLFALAFGAAWRWGNRSSPLFLAGFFCASAVLGHVFRFGPEAFRFAAVVLALVAWQTLREGRENGSRRHLVIWAAAGGLVAAAGTHAPLDLLAALPVAVDLAWARRGKPLAAFLVGSLAALGGLLAAQHHLLGTAWPSAGAEVCRFYDAFPIEGPADLWSQTLPEGAGAGAASGALRAGVVSFWVGRTTGLLAFFPFALVALAGSVGRGWERPRILLLVAVLLGCGALVLAGGARPTGLGDPRFAGLYPLLLFLPGRIGNPLTLAGLAAAGLWTAPAVLASWLAVPATVPAPAFARLPLELPLLTGNRPGRPEGAGLPGYSARVWGEAVWLLPADEFFAGERNPRGVWMRGASAAEVIVVSPRPLAALAFTAVSLAADNELLVDGGAGTVRVVFDSPGKRAGTPIELPLAALTRDLGGFFPSETYYRLRMRASGGLVPARRDASASDPRYLGVFLEPAFLDSAGQGR